MLLVAVFLMSHFWSAQGQMLKHMAAHGHDLKHQHHDQGSAPPSGEENDPLPFNEAFAELQKFYEKEGHSKVPQKVTVNLPSGREFKLGKW